MNFDIRQSQAIHTWPTGAVIDFPQLSLIMLCHDNGNGEDWGKPDNDHNNSRNFINDPRLAEAFKVSSFIVPPVYNGLSSTRLYGIRFPSAHYCPKCGMMEVTKQSRGHKLGKRNMSYDADMLPFWCEACFDTDKISGPLLIPMRFVIANEDGFLDDFPWDWYVHRNCPEQRNKGHKLFYSSRGGSASLGDIVIVSKDLSGNKIAQTDLSDIFDQKIFAKECSLHGHYLQYINYQLSQPWKGWGNDGHYYKQTVQGVLSFSDIWDGDELTIKAKAKFPRTIQRGAGNIIFPIVYSSILLPESTYHSQCPPAITEKISNTVMLLKDSSPEEYEDFTNDIWREYFINRVDKRWGDSLKMTGFTASQLNIYIKQYFGDDSSQSYVNKAANLRLQEYNAFCGTVMSDDQIWFEKRTYTPKKYNDLLQVELFESVVLLDKLSAIKVLRGFTRIKPLMTDELIFAHDDDDLSMPQKAELHRIQDARQYPEITNQLPAVEVKGEGIFLKFNKDQLYKWSDMYPDARVNTINRNLKEADLAFQQQNEPLNKRYLFLHTFAHIILKELAEDSGYSLSSLAEIIYCSQDDKKGTDDEMNGILIYTTTSDAEGSLGGLVEKGGAEYLSIIIQKALDKAQWCSSDPLCISASGGQGFMGLNLAACYSCVLLPETCCEKMNKYLDRAALIGTLENKEYGYFG
jgi:hypothetical protein